MNSEPRVPPNKQLLRLRLKPLRYSHRNLCFTEYPLSHVRFPAHMLTSRCIPVNKRVLNIYQSACIKMSRKQQFFMYKLYKPTCLMHNPLFLMAQALTFDKSNLLESPRPPGAIDLQATGRKKPVGHAKHLMLPKWSWCRCLPASTGLMLWMVQKSCITDGWDPRNNGINHL